MSVLLLISPLSSQAGWKDSIKELKDNAKESINDVKLSSKETHPPDEKTIVKGLKQALHQGVEKSIEQLGKKNGFLHDASVKIPMPKTLKKVDKGLRKLGQDKYADRFINTMNHAAEEAVPKTIDILLEALKAMTLKDAVNILKGEPDAATQYFKRTSSSSLRKTIKPIVVKATSAVGLTDVYKKMMKKAGYLAKYVDQDSLDIDQYITNKAIDGLFLKIAVEEKRIRKDPVARTTDILKEVFGN